MRHRSIKMTKRNYVLENSLSYMTMNPMASVEDIAKNSQISKATFHRMFTGREDFLFELAILSIGKLKVALKNIDETNLDLKLERILEILIKNGDHVYYLFYYPNPESTDKILSLLKTELDFYYAFLETCYHNKILNSQIPLPLLENTIHSIVSMIWIQKYLGNYTESDAVTFGKQLIMKGITQ